MPKYLIDTFSYISDEGEILLVVELNADAAYSKAVNYCKKDATLVVCSPLEVEDSDLVGEKFKEI